MKTSVIHRLLNFCIAGVWFVNGFFCKLLNLVPRHQKIVAEILGSEFAVIFTKLIGISEVFMAIWILSRFQSRLNAILQIVIVITMNVLEFLLVPDLLLWGSFNSIFALIFVGIVYCNEFVSKK